MTIHLFAHGCFFNLLLHIYTVHNMTWHEKSILFFYFSPALFTFFNFSISPTFIFALFSFFFTSKNK
ncbi:hypothetical protein GLOIN_2v1493263 [Rhizophagus irregularis DAOM 181602=DAOM 197198]|uniref:Uncharacterized protein n=1 Tax=Rhizophagus irregularis (strain DAOM 181602 / DAOM 197198 / MUCL 43194) TaxID=747089 RepID=A0A2P4QYJ6_RHIID|nr:hypothetical protein GLOIN_2v1493263 [Rhizophagus irregularis DAOM 181602=DAOM 197198]POG82730.1 hypothetical protein GLOIN_2v1493263 [Rhizophagus irregularis DAOM 181602=DAOM 197198]GET51423.1 hypothetical protein GLOIN_2v1493263 [Rhizophagus irregularis DAOM 181602=DAOM 197198]|eukprot:XP_025189596.1 hypothetical protein GLOIN_2v1493263 [Rhizophagus irregularis DAOM 181602=DAOM 197198]